MSLFVHTKHSIKAGHPLSVYSMFFKVVQNREQFTVELVSDLETKIIYTTINREWTKASALLLIK